MDSLLSHVYLKMGYVSHNKMSLLFQARGVHLEHDSDLITPVSDGGLNVKVHMDAAGVLHWPVMFVYPEFNETDFISSFCENDR